MWIKTENGELINSDKVEYFTPFEIASGVVNDRVLAVLGVDSDNDERLITLKDYLTTSERHELLRTLFAALKRADRGFDVNEVLAVIRGEKKGF